MVARTEDRCGIGRAGWSQTMIETHPDGAATSSRELAGPLPLQVICEMMGIPEEDHERIFHWTNVILGFGDPDIATDFDEFAQVAMEIGAYAHRAGRRRRGDPPDDLTTALVQAEVDGERLTTAEIASFFILLVVAGNETTRNAISHGVLALTRYPDQRTVVGGLRGDGADGGRGDRPVGVAGDLHAPHADRRQRAAAASRWRPATRWRCGTASANRDEAQVRRPVTLRRRAAHPNPQVGFGGGGPHFCLGANLARREITVAFGELHRQVPDIHAAGEPDRLLSPFIHGIKRLPVSWTPPS